MCPEPAQRALLFTHFQTRVCLENVYCSQRLMKRSLPTCNKTRHCRRHEITSNILPAFVFLTLFCLRSLFNSIQSKGNHSHAIKVKSSSKFSERNNFELESETARAIETMPGPERVLSISSFAEQLDGRDERL